jgi:glycine/D-amino acid oxidase-like deaminating enzyme
MKAKVNGDVSFWYADIGGVPAYRAPLPGDRDADICVVGAGFTGLWTAYYLKKANPDLRIVIVEKEFAGFGASGRNGGWLSGGFGWSREKYLKTSTRGSVVDMETAMHGTVDEVIGVLEREGIDADVKRADTLTVATNRPQLERIEAAYQDALDWSVPQARISLIGEAETKARINIKNALGGFVHHGTARVQPAKLVRGLAATVERLGVSIFEQTEVTRIEKGVVSTTRGTVRAPIIVRATEGFTAGIAGFERLWVPMNSAILMTEPVPDALWDEIGWKGYELMGDAAHAYCYAQRTREGRIAMGGRGVPYRYGSRTDTRGQTQQETIDQLYGILMRLLPQTRTLKIEHAWCGVLGVPRDWCTTVGLDRNSGIAWAGGYVGLGVSTSNLSGRTLADLILERDTPLTRLPWVNRAVREWEPEPLRWLGVHSMYQLYHVADRREAQGMAHTSRIATFADKITGH